MDTLKLAALAFAVVAQARRQWPQIDGPTRVLPLLAVVSLLAAWGLGEPAAWEEVLRRASTVFVLTMAGAEGMARIARGKAS